MVPADIFTALSPLVGVDVVDIFDTKRPDNYDLTGAEGELRTILVYSQVSDVPGVPIDGEIIGRTERWQISVYSKGLAEARAAKVAVIAALHGYRGDTIQWAEFDSSPGEDYNSDALEYHIPIDFVIESADSILPVSA